jgi:hypothetical protein
MFPPSRNEKKADQSIIARVFYFVIGLSAGAYLTLKYVAYSEHPMFLGLTAIACGFVGMILGRGIFEFFK